jgi:hypothetical protein
MNVTELSDSLRDKLLPKWVDGFFSSYPLSGTGFLRTGIDPFTNPVGMATRSSLAVLYDAVPGNDVAPADLRLALARLMEVRAVQDMSPSRAVGALYLLKNLFREHVLPACSGQDALLREYLEAESRIDSLALLAFDLYSHDREKVFSARVEEVKRSQSQVLRWAQKNPQIRGVEE